MPSDKSGVVYLVMKWKPHDFYTTILPWLGGFFISPARVISLYQKEDVGLAAWTEKDYGSLETLKEILEERLTQQAFRKVDNIEGLRNGGDFCVLLYWNENRNTTCALANDLVAAVDRIIGVKKVTGEKRRLKIHVPTKFLAEVKVEFERIGLIATITPYGWFQDIVVDYETGYSPYMVVIVKKALEKVGLTNPTNDSSIFSKDTPHYGFSEVARL